MQNYIHHFAIGSFLFPSRSYKALNTNAHAGVHKSEHRYESCYNIINTIINNTQRIQNDSSNVRFTKSTSNILA